MLSAQKIPKRQQSNRGPRRATENDKLAMRLTPNVLHDAIANVVSSSTLSLRDSSIPLLENLDVVPDIFTVLDITNNDIVTLGNFPLLFKVTTLLLAKNNISNIQDSIALQLPQLRTLSLIDNSIGDYATLERLSSLTRLENLYISGNPIMLMEHVREFVIWCLPHLKVLNFERVRQSERERCLELFGPRDEPSELADKLRSVGSQRRVYSQSDQLETVVKKLSDEEREQLKEQLKSATSLKEIEKIEDMLRKGYM